MEIEVFTKHLIVIIVWLNYLCLIFITIRQHNLTFKITRVPEEIEDVVSQRSYERLRLYFLDRLKLHFLKLILEPLIASVIVYYKLYAIAWQLAEKRSLLDSEIGRNFTWLVFALAIKTLLIIIPLRIIETFVIRESHGLNKETPRTFALAEFGKFLMRGVGMGVSGIIFFYLAKWGLDYYFPTIILTAGMTFFRSVSLQLHPMHFKYKLLRDTDLKIKIEHLASVVGYPLKNIYVEEMYSHQTNSNVYYAGLIFNKRIVIHDVLLSETSKIRCTDDEIVALVAHEFGHWKYFHSKGVVLLDQINMWFQMYMFAMLLNFDPLYQIFGFESNHPILVGKILILDYVLFSNNTMFTLIKNYYTRSCEYQADKFSVGMTKGQDLINALLKLNKNNFNMPYDNLYSILFYSRSTAIERISAIKKYM